jgi:hypothetical protein
VRATSGSSTRSLGENPFDLRVEMRRVGPDCERERIDAQAPVRFPARKRSGLADKRFWPNYAVVLAVGGVKCAAGVVPVWSLRACRDTFAAWSIAAGVQLFYLSRIVGMSVAMIDATYGHLVPDSEMRGLLDAHDIRDDEATEEAQQRVR